MATRQQNRGVSCVMRSFDPSAVRLRALLRTMLRGRGSRPQLRAPLARLSCAVWCQLRAPTARLHCTVRGSRRSTRHCSAWLRHKGTNRLCGIPIGRLHGIAAMLAQSLWRLKTAAGCIGRTGSLGMIALLGSRSLLSRRLVHLLRVVTRMQLLFPDIL